MIIQLSMINIPFQQSIHNSNYKFILHQQYQVQDMRPYHTLFFPQPLYPQTNLPHFSNHHRLSSLNIQQYNQIPQCLSSFPEHPNNPYSSHNRTHYKHSNMSRQILEPDNICHPLMQSQEFQHAQYLEYLNWNPDLLYQPRITAFLFDLLENRKYSLNILSLLSSHINNLSPVQVQNMRCLINQSYPIEIDYPQQYQKVVEIDQKQSSEFLKLMTVLSELSFSCEEYIHRKINQLEVLLIRKSQAMEYLCVTEREPSETPETETMAIIIEEIAENVDNLKETQLGNNGGKKEIILEKLMRLYYSLLSLHQSILPSTHKIQHVIVKFANVPENQFQLKLTANLQKHLQYEVIKILRKSMSDPQIENPELKQEKQRSERESANQRWCLKIVRILENRKWLKQQNFIKILKFMMDYGIITECDNSQVANYCLEEVLKVSLKPKTNGQNQLDLW